jgi:C4-dicarboxylate-specific signal transduction histidine kinase
MEAPASLQLVTMVSVAMFSFHACATMLLWGIARAPGWERVRVMMVATSSAALYSLVNVFGSMPSDSVWGIGLSTTLNLTVAALLAASLLWFTFSDARGAWGSMPAWVRALGIGSVGFPLALTVTNRVVLPDTVDRIAVPALGVEFAQGRMTALGTAAALLVLAVLLVILLEHVRRARRGVRGAKGVVAGYVLFIACAIEEGLVSIGVVDFIYLAELGYLALIAPVTLAMLRKFTRDAHRLELLSDRLADQVESALAERDSARDALAAQERMAALGRIAGGIGHEINNPLQYLTFSLEELRDLTRSAAGRDGDEAVANAFDAVERIKRIVEGLRAYSTPLRAEQDDVDLHEVVRTALRLSQPHLRALPLVQQVLRAVPPVRGDAGKLVQAVMNAVVNAAHVLKAHPPAAPAAITVSTRALTTGEAEIEVRDNGPGFPAELLPTLGQPFVTTRATDGGSGLGIFVIRGIVDAHGGTVELGNAESGGAVLRIRLPRRRADAAQGTTAVASISTTAPASMSAETSTAVIAG